MSERWQKFNGPDGRFGLSSNPGGSYADCSDDGDLGTGGGQRIMAFQSEEGREYFIQSDMWERQARLNARDLRWFKQSLAECVTPTGRVRRKRLLALIEKVMLNKDGNLRRPLPAPEAVSTPPGA